uniref:Protein kinase domain-containing protein n=1 Tax=Steinernema glaseri TaxID=37863 RepID=A0A1I7YTN1_9BILA
MVLDFLPTDLLKLRREKKRIDNLDSKVGSAQCRVRVNQKLSDMYAYQIYDALDYIHSMGICHRDLKPSNLIVDDAKGLLKLADFGSAKILKPDEVNLAYQVTRYYRAPELIFGSTSYTLTIDLWAAACIVSELFTGKILLSGRNSENQ